MNNKKVKEGFKQNYYSQSKSTSFPKAVVAYVVNEILETYKKENNNSIKNITVLDVGCGEGDYSALVAKRVKKVVAVEPYLPAYKKVLVKYKNINNLVFKNCMIENLKLKTKFDLVLSLTTIEHMPKAEISFETIFKMMKKGGLIYLTAPNKFWPIECHYHLPFLSWLPLKYANLYLRLSGKVDSYEDCSYSKTFLGMKRFFNKYNCEIKFVLSRSDNKYIGCGNNSKGYKTLKTLGISLISRIPAFWMFSKGFIMIIRKL